MNALGADIALLRILQNNVADLPEIDGNFHKAFRNPGVFENSVTESYSYLDALGADIACFRFVLEVS